MKKEQIITRSITVDASTAEVWDALTNPEKTKQYMFNTAVQSSWKVGDSIKWVGNYQGYESNEQGIVLAYEPEKKLAYTSFDPNFGLADISENHLHVKYELTPTASGTELITTIINYNGDEQCGEHVASMWDTLVLPGIQQLFSKSETSV